MNFSKQEEVYQIIKEIYIGAKYRKYPLSSYSVVRLYTMKVAFLSKMSGIQIQRYFNWLSNQ